MVAVVVLAALYQQAALVGVLAACLPLLVRDVWGLTALKLGDARAAALGVQVQALRIRCFVLISVLTGIAVAFVGTIGFAGLGIFVGDIVVVLHGAHRPHDGDALVDVAFEVADFELFEGVVLGAAAFAVNLGADVGEEELHGGAAASLALAGHGEEIHVSFKAHGAHGTLESGGCAVAFRALVNHGDF